MSCRRSCTSRKWRHCADSPVSNVRSRITKPALLRSASARLTRGSAGTSGVSRVPPAGISRPHTEDNWGNRFDLNMAAQGVWLVCKSPSDTLGSPSPNATVRLDSAPGRPRKVVARGPPVGSGPDRKRGPPHPAPLMPRPSCSGSCRSPSTRAPASRRPRPSTRCSSTTYVMTASHGNSRIPACRTAHQGLGSTASRSNPRSTTSVPRDSCIGKLPGRAPSAESFFRRFGSAEYVSNIFANACLTATRNCARPAR